MLLYERRGVALVFYALEDITMTSGPCSLRSGGGRATLGLTTAKARRVVRSFLRYVGPSCHTAGCAVQSDYGFIRPGPGAEGTGR